MFEVTLSQIFVAAMVVSQVLTDPANIKTHFDPQTEQEQAVAVLRKGCPAIIQQLGAEMGMELTVEQSGISELLNLFISSGQELPIPGLKAATLDVAFRKFCKGENVNDPAINMSAIINEYNNSLDRLPDVSKIKGYKLPQSTVVLDVFGNRFTEVYKDRNRRIWIPLNEIPPHVVMAFISAEDTRFRSHKGVDIRGIVRAYMNNKSKSEAEARRRPEGGSTITQQVIKNLLVGGVLANGSARADDELTEGTRGGASLGPGDEITAARKIREMVLAAQLENVLGKEGVLELYLNYVFLGRSSWGVEMAALSYFGKSIRQVDKLEAAILAGLTKGPNYFNPEVFPDRFRGRTAYVLSQMLKLSNNGEQKFLTRPEHDDARKKIDAFDPHKTDSPVKLVDFEGPRSKGSFYFISDIINDSAIGLGDKQLTDSPYVVKTTIHPKLQPIAESAVQESLAEYEISTGRVKWSGPEKNIQSEIEKFAEENPDQNAANAWHKVLQQTKAPLYDVHWPLAVVVQTGKNGVKVGLKDGRHVTLTSWSGSVAKSLKMYDVVHVKVTGNTAALRFRPKVQGAAIIIENRSGRVLALAGGFSYALDHYNRATSMIRQPGSTVKPLTYLAALQAGMRPTTLIPDEALSFPSLVRNQPEWHVGPGSGRMLSLRQGLERSNNQVTARLLYQIGRGNPAAGLDTIQDLCMETKLCNSRPFRGFPFVLGAHDIRLIDLASFYSTIANDGVRARPYYVESIALQGQEVFNAAHTFRDGLTQIASVSAANFREVKSMLQGVLARGTATKISRLAPYIGGKTGTTNRGKDVWFVGFTNDITIATWVGYDKARALGNGCANDANDRCSDPATGGKIALPIFEKIISKISDERAYKDAPLVALNAPHPELAVAGLEPREENDEQRGFGNWWPEPQQPRYEQRRPYWAPPEDYDDYRRQRYQQQQRRGQPWWSPFGSY